MYGVWLNITIHSVIHSIFYYLIVIELIKRYNKWEYNKVVYGCISTNVHHGKAFTYHAWVLNGKVAKTSNAN